VVKDNYEITAGDDYVYVKGVCNITVDGNANLKVGGNLTTNVQGNYNLRVGGDFNLDVYGQTNNRYESKYEVWYGDDTLTRKQSGKTDFTCPADIRNSGTDCSDVPGL
jgi:hypothetical protein